ncbi:MAG: hypothetical protein Q8900_10655 [Bacillota bacterium]|nr:hypothetical protein [Bacillota bacterium]
MKQFLDVSFPKINSITIKSERMSFIQSKSFLRIYQYKNTYLMEYKNNSNYIDNNMSQIDFKAEEIPAWKVQQLEYCLSEEPIKKGKFLNYENILKWVKKYSEFRGVPRIELDMDIEKKLRKTSYLNNKAINKYFKRLGGADNYPHIRVEVKFKIGTVMIIESSVKRELMLPWTVAINNKIFENCNINLALSELMLKGFTNRKLILGEKYFIQLLKLNIGIKR